MAAPECTTSSAEKRACQRIHFFHAKDGVIYNLSAEDMLHTRPDLLKHTILPQLSVRHLRRARESVRVTITQSDLAEFARWGGPRSVQRQDSR